MEPTPVLIRSRGWWLLLAAVLFGLGLAVRLFDLTDLPLDFHPTRQLHSAVMARGMVYESLTSAPEWQRERAVQQGRAEPVIEPPLMEWLAAISYKAAGAELLWIPRVYAIIFWMLGGLGMLLLAHELSGRAGGWIGLAYFLALPYGILASRAFQPDPLMTALIAWAWWALARWLRTPTWKWSWIAGLLGGMAILSKAVALFFVLGGLAGALLSAGLWAALRSRRAWLLVILSVLPYGVYHLYGMYIAGFLQGQTSLRFFPDLWLQPGFYLRWLDMLRTTVGLEWLLAGLLGVLLLKDRGQRGLALGAWLGYGVYGLTLAHHISTHDYYQLPLIPLVGLGLAAAGSALFEQVRLAPRLRGGLLALFILAAALIGSYQARTVLKKVDYRPEAAFWQGLGEKLGQDAAVTGLMEDYGYRLEYWGWITPANWFTAAEFDYRAGAGQGVQFAEYFQKQTAGRQYFVVTLLDELERQPELKALLTRDYPLLERGARYEIYDLRKK